MHTIIITPNLLFEYQSTSGKFIRLPNRIETFLPELECSRPHCISSNGPHFHASHAMRLNGDNERKRHTAAADKIQETKT